MLCPNGHEPVSGTCVGCPPRSAPPNAEPAAWSYAWGPAEPDGQLWVGAESGQWGSDMRLRAPQVFASQGPPWHRTEAEAGAGARPGPRDRLSNVARPRHRIPRHLRFLSFTWAVPIVG